MKQLETMTRKQIEQLLKDNNMKIDRAYKMSKSELIAAIESGIENEELFDPSKRYVFSKDKYLQYVKTISGESVLNNVLEDTELIEWLDRIDGKEVKQNFDCWNSVYVEDTDETFKRTMCDELIEEYTLESKEKEVNSEIKLENGMVVHCSTEDQANKFLEICDKQGIVWGSGNKTTNYNNWDKHGPETCYNVVEDWGLMVCSKQFYLEEMGAKVIEFEDLFLEKKIDATMLSLMPDGITVIVKIKDFKDKNRYFARNTGTLETNAAGYKVIKIKNKYRTRYVSVWNSKDIDFFVLEDDYKKFEEKAS